MYYYYCTVTGIINNIVFLVRIRWAELFIIIALQSPGRQNQNTRPDDDAKRERKK